MDRTQSPGPNRRYNSPFVSCSVRSRTSTTPMRLGHRRYALADTFQTPEITKQKRTWNNHISTRIDSNSPGYSSRVVQYNEEQEKSSANQQSPHSKYDKLGVFPIVHFFKKDLPVLKRKAEDPNPQLNSSELSRYNSSEHNRMLLEKIIKSSPGSQESPHKNDLSAKSVLDALKEISRKRIQSNGEEFVLNEDGKRMFVEHHNENSSSKRQRQNSHREDHVATPLANRNKPIDEVMASRSSMEGYFPNKPKEKRTVTEKTVTPKPTPVVVKKVDVETQTLVPQPPAVPQSVLELEVTKKEEKTPQETKVKKTSPVKVFDETPLVAMRRNRLIALMGTLNKPETKTTEPAKTEEPIQSKPLVSILSGSTKSPHKSPKHVTFDLPETENSVTSSESNSIPSSRPNTNYNIEQSSVTKTSTSLVVPIVSASVVESTSPQKPVASSTEIVSVSSKNDSVVSTSSPVLSSSGLMFGNPTLSLQSPNPVSSGINAKSDQESSVSISKENPVGFGKSNPLVKPSGANDSSKQAGFKFELKNTPTTTGPQSSAPFSFVSPPTTTPTTSLLPQFTASSSVKGNLPSFTAPNSLGQGTLSFGGANSLNPPISFSPKPATTLSSTTSSPSSFGNSSLSSTFSLPTTTSSANSFTPNFGNKVPAPNFMSSVPTTKPPLFNFAQTPATTIATNFTVPSVSTVASSLVSQNNGNTTPTFAFPTASVTTAPMTFGVQKNTVSTTSPFGTQNNFSTATSSAPSLFPGSDTKTTAANSFFFGSSNTFNKSAGDGASSSNFGTDAKSMFTPAAAPSFNTTTTASFGSTNTLSSTASSFGNVGTTPFGGGFGTSTNPPPFSLNANTNFGGSNFGGQKSGFGNLSENKGGFTQSSGTSNTPSFFQPTFGATTTASSFNTGANTFSSTQASFGSPQPGSTFGQASNNTGASTFNSPFEKQASSSVTPFGSNNSAAPNVSPFGSTNPSTVPNVTPFGSSNPSFGSSGFSANPQVTQSSVFTFGSTTNTKPGVFSFGSSEPPKPLFNFQGENNTNAFGANSKGFGASSAPSTFGTSNPPSTFGASNPPSTFGALPTPQFNVPPTGMFNIGAGGSSTPSRSRVPHKSKRRN